MAGAQSEYAYQTEQHSYCQGNKLYIRCMLDFYDLRNNDFIFFWLLFTTLDFVRLVYCA